MCLHSLDPLFVFKANQVPLPPSLYPTVKKGPGPQQLTLLDWVAAYFKALHSYTCTWKIPIPYLVPSHRSQEPHLLISLGPPPTHHGPYGQASRWASQSQRGERLLQGHTGCAWYCTAFPGHLLSIICPPQCWTHELLTADSHTLLPHPTSSQGLVLGFRIRGSLPHLSVESSLRSMAD